MSEIKQYRVSGYALMPVEVEIKVRARSKQEARRLALNEFNSPGGKRPHVVSGSEDESAVHNWRADAIEEIES